MINSTHNSGNDGDSTGSDFSPSPPIYVLAVVVILTAVASILGNSLVQIAFWRTKSLKQSSPATLVMVLACVDLCMATFVMPFVVITALHDKWFLNHDLCVATGFINTLLTALQFGILFSISINRFSAVSNPHRYQVTWTTKITYGMISFVFGHSLLWSLMPFMGWGGYGFSPGTLYCNIDWSKHKSHSISLFAFCYIIPAIIAGILYIAVYIKTRRIGKGHAADVRENRKDLNVVNGGRDEESCSDMHGRTLTDSTFSLNMKERKIYQSNVSINSGTPARRHSQRTRESRVTKSLLLVAAAFAIFWLPRGLVNFWAVVGGRNSVPKALEYLTTVFIFMNSFVNPILYGLFHHEYNKAFRHILRCSNTCVSGESV